MSGQIRVLLWIVAHIAINICTGDWQKEYEEKKELRTSTTLGSDRPQLDTHCMSRRFIVRKTMSIPTNTTELLPATTEPKVVFQVAGIAVRET
jgi:hypothetical protein